ncbi:MAG: maleylpyruvate isomerase family mycothiol-dependent enzyme [Rhodococcus sp.]|nr:maleylpyruvate isomerase family mycothiol-dependent enzyme [Rhodococcus sp. (in: high G+C Gram-positive bacteria)]
MKKSPAAIWQVVHDERHRLAADLADLDDELWGTASLCPGWTVHDVLAHLVDSAKTGRLTFIRDMVTARGNFDRANDKGIARAKCLDPLDTLRELSAAADSTRTPPANLATRLVEAIVHGEDIRRPLGIAGKYPPSAITQAMDYQLRTKVGFGGGRERAAGLQLIDKTTGTTWGTGEPVEADAIDLLLAVSGRPVPADRFTETSTGHGFS